MNKAMSARPGRVKTKMRNLQRRATARPALGRSRRRRKPAALATWEPIDTAPKDRRILMFGKMRAMMGGLRTDGPEVFSGYWDDIDSAWCGSGSTADGPFYTPTHWQELPSRPLTN